MIKSLRQARITDGLPGVVAGQDWVIALSEALGLALGRTLDYTDKSQIYTNLDNAPEEVLDALAVNWKIDWYDTSFTLDQKRRTVKTALTVRRLMGTAAAVKLQVDAVYPGAKVEEWFQYQGEPGYFRLVIDLPDGGMTAEEYRRLKNGALLTKNVRSHLDVIDIRWEDEAVLLTGGFVSTCQTLEVWPELTTGLEVAGEVHTGGGTATGQTMEVWPERVTGLEVSGEVRTGGGTATGQTMEVWPELVSRLEITGKVRTGGGPATKETVEVWPGLTVQLETSGTLNMDGATATGRFVEIYPEGEDEHGL